MATTGPENVVLSEWERARLGEIERRLTRGHPAFALRFKALSGAPAWLRLGVAVALTWLGAVMVAINASTSPRAAFGGLGVLAAGGLLAVVPSCLSRRFLL
jgi:hypothetical protein